MAQYSRSLEGLAILHKDAAVFTEEGFDITSSNGRASDVDADIAMLFSSPWKLMQRKYWGSTQMDRLALILPKADKAITAQIKEFGGKSRVRVERNKRQ